MPRFTIGQGVRIRELNKLGHVRTPFYVRRRTGTVVQFCGTFLCPEDLALGRTAGPVVECYRVEFKQAQLWDDYDGVPEDTLTIEIYAHWLEPVENEPRFYE